MNINISSVHFDADKKLEDFINNKVNKLAQFYNKIEKTDVVLKVDKPHSIDNKIAEITLHVPGNNLFSKKQNDTFEKAIDEAVEALKKQLEKIKEKR